MMRHRRHTVACAAAVVLALICGPVAIWLQARAWHVDPTGRPDVLYVVAGARHQDLRVDAAASWLRRAGTAPRVFVGNDRTRGGWSSTAQRNLTVGEWAAVKLRLRLEVTSGGRDIAVEIVPGEFDGTDAEMRALASFVRRDSAVGQVAIVTSAFHARRTLTALRRHLDGACGVAVITVAPRFEDYMPWVVIGEAAKLARDCAGLADAPLLSRTSWFDERDVPVVLVFLLLVYAWLIYPRLLRLLAWRKKNASGGAERRAGSGQMHPHVTVLIAAYNEEANIGQRIANLLEGQWPRDRLDVWVGSDGSSDRTVDAARAAGAGNARVHVVVFEARRGKAAVLRDLAEASAKVLPENEREGDVLLFTDANSSFDTGAIGVMVDALADSGAGGACGRLVFTREPGRDASDSSGREESGYWEWETVLKRSESRLDSCLGANGAIYAVKRVLFWTGLPANTIVDDFVIGMKVREQGWSMVYVDGAVAREALPPSERDEWRRRVRIGAGVFQALALCGRCLSPRFGWFAWMFWSHKVLRWFTPHLLLVLLGMSLHVLVARIREGAGWSVGLAMGGVVLLLLLVAPAGIPARNMRGRAAGALRLAWYFVYIQAAMLTGFFRFCRGGLSGVWERTRR